MRYVTMGGNMMDSRTFLSCSHWFLWLSSLFRMVEFIHKVADHFSPFVSQSRHIPCILLPLYMFDQCCEIPNVVLPDSVSERGCWHLAYKQQCTLVVPDTASCFICVYFSLFQHSQPVLFSDFSVEGLPHPVHS